MSNFLRELMWWLISTGLVNLFAHRSQVDAWCERQPKLAAILKLVRGVGFDPWLLLQGLSLFAKGKLPERLKTSLPVFLALLLAGCGFTTKEREACYARADSAAFAEYVSECKEHPNLSECPKFAEIEARHKLAQEACP